MESCERATSDFFSAMWSLKGCWYYLFDLNDTSLSLSHMFRVSIDELLDVFETLGFVKKVEKKLLLLRYGVRTIQCCNPPQVAMIGIFNIMSHLNTI